MNQHQIHSTPCLPSCSLSSTTKRCIQLKTLTAETSSCPEVEIPHALKTSSLDHPGRYHILSVLDHFTVQGPNGSHLLSGFHKSRDRVLLTCHFALDEDGAGCGVVAWCWGCSWEYVCMPCYINHFVYGCLTCSRSQAVEHTCQTHRV